MAKWIGLDIGGANLKLAHIDGTAHQCRFPMWKHPDRLSSELGRLLEVVSPFDAVALTMTGEMADCFATREEGVCRILEQVTRIIPAGCLRIYTVDGEWMGVSQAARAPWNVAASNWRALAEYAVRWTEGEPTLLIDIGSTTTDIVAILDNKVVSESRSDRERLISGELVYTGTERSSIVGLVDELTVHGQPCPVINEYFATTGDVHVVLGFTPEDPCDCETADRQPRTRYHAAHRLARVVGEDGSTLADQDIEAMAEAIYASQIQHIARSVLKVALPFHRRVCQSVLFSGHGDYLIDDVLNQIGWGVRRERLSEKLGSELSRCAPAYAVAVLAEETFDG